MPGGFWLLIALGLPFIGAVTVTGIYLNKEVIVAAAWVAFSIAASVLFEPVIGVVTMAGVFLLAAYPTVLQDLGFLTINNLLGLVLLVCLLSYVIRSRDLSYLTIRQILLLLAIGILLVLSTLHANVLFPNMQPSQSLGVKGKALDRTADMMHDFWARLIFLMFVFAFVQRRRDVSALFAVYVMVLFLAVPSALINWWNGTLSHGFRAEASLTAGSNANRLAMICLMEVGAIWCWLRARPNLKRWMLGLPGIIGAFVVVLACGSRSGLLGCGVTAVLMQTGPRRFRATPFHVALAVVAGVVAVLTVVPPDAWVRMTTFSTADQTTQDTLAARGAASSLALREDTIAIGLRMISDHPVLGIGLGNYREVSRQVYLDQFFRPPHNSVIWAAAEGGLLNLAAYGLLFLMTWNDLRRVLKLSARDPRVAYIAAALRIIFLLYCYFALLADLALNPITYVLIGIIVTLRRYLERLPAPAAVPALAVAR
jgi:O-antigen ligase